MITVAGFNTSIDRLYSIGDLHAGEVMRASRVEIFPGGKGLHVAQTIAALGERVRLVGLTDRAHAAFIGARMHERGVEFHGVETPGMLRSCVALREAGGRISEVLDPGDEAVEAVRTALIDAFERCAGSSGALVLSGSLPLGFAADTYAQLVRRYAQANLPCYVDASGETLRLAAGASAFLIKPNRDEASELCARAIATVADAAQVARQLHAQGVARPIVTMGEHGAIGFDGKRCLRAWIGLTRNVNAVGSGDCLLAGVVVAFARGGSLEEALRLGAACGAANAMNEETGYVRAGQVDSLLGAVHVEEID